MRIQNPQMTSNHSSLNQTEYFSVDVEYDERLAVRKNNLIPQPYHVYFGLFIFSTLFAWNHRFSLVDSAQSMLRTTRQYSKTVDSKPNFVFILADDLGWNAIGYHDFDLSFATPALSALAKNGITMSSYYAQEVCTPSRASLMTGRYPLTIGMQFGEVDPAAGWGLNLTETLLPEVLQSAGYGTYMLGKWHLGHYSPKYLPTARGFDYSLGYMSGQSYYWSKREPNFPKFHDLTYSNSECYSLYNGSDKHSYSTFFYRDKAVDIITLHDYDEKPLFLYVSMQAVHDPYFDQHKFTNGVPFEYLDDGMYDLIMENVSGRKRRQYAMSLVLLDDAVQKIQQAVTDAGQETNTYIIFASDNGGCFSAGGKNGPLRGTKGSLWEGGVKVDSFISGALLPETLRGSSYDGIMHVSDWFPTILELASVSYSPDEDSMLDGVSQVQAWTLGVDSNLRTFLLYNYYIDIQGEHFSVSVNAPVAIRNSRYKLIHANLDNPTAEWYNYDENLDDDSTLTEGQCDQYSGLKGNYTVFLFDLLEDPYETTNLFDEPDGDGLYEVLTNAMYDQLSEYKKNSKISYGIESMNKAAKNAWRQQGSLVSPWIKEQDIEEFDASYPDYCSFTGSLVSPIFFAVDDDNWLDDDGDSNDDDDDSILASAIPTEQPSQQPTEEALSFNPTVPPTFSPSSSPTLSSTANNPTAGPIAEGPSCNPSSPPTARATPRPTGDIGEETQQPTSPPSARATPHPSEGVPTVDDDHDARLDEDDLLSVVSTEPTAQPSTEEPYDVATASPSSDPVASPPVPCPAARPVKGPTRKPIIQPTSRPSVGTPADYTFYPTLNPSMDPSSNPTQDPTSEPTVEPTASPPVPCPAARPVKGPTRKPTIQPTSRPSEAVQVDLTFYPTLSPAFDPSSSPTQDPTDIPIVVSPTEIPTKARTRNPSVSPTSSASTTPASSQSPSSSLHVDQEISLMPTDLPTDEPNVPPTTNSKTYKPSPSSEPSQSPSRARPMYSPSLEPTGNSKTNDEVVAEPSKKSHKRKDAVSAGTSV